MLPLLEASGRIVHNVSLDRPRRSPRRVGTAHHARRPRSRRRRRDRGLRPRRRHARRPQLRRPRDHRGGSTRRRPHRHASSTSTRTPPSRPDTGPDARADRRRRGRRAGCSSSRTSYDPDPAEFGGDAGVAWFRERVVPQSFATFMTPMNELPPDDRPHLRVRDRLRPVTLQPRTPRRHAPTRRGTTTRLAGSHWLMFSHPDEVADIILR